MYLLCTDWDPCHLLGTPCPNAQFQNLEALELHTERTSGVIPKLILLLQSTRKLRTLEVDFEGGMWAYNGTMTAGMKVKLPALRSLRLFHFVQPVAQQLIAAIDAPLLQDLHLHGIWDQKHNWPEQWGSFRPTFPSLRSLSVSGWHFPMKLVQQLRSTDTLADFEVRPSPGFAQYFVDAFCAHKFPALHSLRTLDLTPSQVWKMVDCQQTIEVVELKYYDVNGEPEETSRSALEELKKVVDFQLGSLDGGPCGLMWFTGLLPDKAFPLVCPLDYKCSLCHTNYPLLARSRGLNHCLRLLIEQCMTS